MTKEKDSKTRILEIVEDYETGVSMFDNDMAQAGIDPKSDFINAVLKELDRAREEGKREVYEAIVYDKNIPHDITTFVAANLWKNMRDKAKEELSKLTTK